MNITKILAKINQSKVNFDRLYQNIGQCCGLLFSWETRVLRKYSCCSTLSIITCARSLDNVPVTNTGVWNVPSSGLEKTKVGSAVAQW